MKPGTAGVTLLLLACITPAEPTQPVRHRLSPQLDLSTGVAFILGEAPRGPILRNPPVSEWPPSLYMRRPIVGYRTTTPDSLRSAWASLDREGKVRCVSAYYGSDYGYLNLRAEFVARHGPPTVDSTDWLGHYSFWIDTWYVWSVAAGRGSTDRGGAVAGGYARDRGDPDPRSPGFQWPCAPQVSHSPVPPRPE